MFLIKLYVLIFDIFLGSFSSINQIDLILTEKFYGKFLKICFIYFRVKISRSIVKVH